MSDVDLTSSIYIWMIIYLGIPFLFGFWIWGKFFNKRDNKTLQYTVSNIVAGICVVGVSLLLVYSRVIKGFGDF